jgi:hypothetical protein
MPNVMLADLVISSNSLSVVDRLIGVSLKIFIIMILQMNGVVALVRLMPFMSDKLLIARN